MTNQEFVSVFKELQQLVIRIYENIEECPFAWGYPERNDSHDVDALAYKRLMELFYALMSSAAYQGNQLLIDMGQFTKAIKSHKNMDKMINGLGRFGFVFGGYSKRSKSFTIACPRNPALLSILFVYCNLRNPEQKPWGDYYSSFERFSHRWIEDTRTQTHEMLFHAKMDESSAALRQIQEWLYVEAASYGYKIDTTHPYGAYEKGCIAYRKGSKGFLLVGERKIDGISTIFSKVIFRNVFEKEKGEMQEFYCKFPNTFKSNCTLCNGSKPADGKCTMRICYEIDGKAHRNCAYNSFFFFHPTLDDIKDIMQLFIIENKIMKPNK